MTYSTGGDIQAADYNTFSTSAAGMNEIFSDTHPGATTLPDAGFGYGQPALSAVSANNNVLATEWESLFANMRACGTHQGTTVTPPVPASGPVSGATIDAVTDSATLSTLISTLKTNKFNLAAGQTSLIVGTAYPDSTPWTTSLVYTYQVDLGSWDNARYYFNAGGSPSLVGSYSSVATPIELAFKTGLDNMSPLRFTHAGVISGNGENLIVSPPGFYGLTTTYQDIYQKYLTGGGYSYYSTSYILVEAKLANTPGTDGKIDFRVSLIDNDAIPEVKSATTTYTTNSIQSAAPVAYPGTFTVVTGGFV